MEDPEGAEGKGERMGVLLYGDDELDVRIMLRQPLWLLTWITN